VYWLHDYQSLIPLLWLLGTTVYTNSRVFVRLTTWFFLPLMLLTYVFYFAVNVLGLVPYSSWSSPEVINMYKYGFMEFQIPLLELGCLYLNLFLVAFWARTVY